MRVAFIFHLKDSFGGAERRLTRIYNELCADYKDVHCDIVVRGCDRKTAVNLFEQADCKVDNIEAIIAFKNSYTCLAYLLFSKKYDAVHFFSASDFNLQVEKICRLSGKKSIYTVCGYREACNIAISEKGTNLVRAQLSRADVIDLLNPSGIEYVSQFINGQLYITPGTFTDLNIFKPSIKENIIVYAAARLDETKNPMLLVEAVNLCKDTLRIQKYKVILLGKGKLENDLHNAIKRYEISDIIDMPGYRKTSDYVPQASVLLSLQSMENYPSQTIAEAAASGCYLIITDVGDSRKCADTSFASFVQNDPKDLAKSIEQYIKLPTVEKEFLKKNARIYAEKHYSIEESKEYFHQILTKLKKGRTAND